MSIKEALTREPRRTLAVAESVTCGGVQRAIGRISGASTFFLGGITAYDRPQKVAHLGVDDAEAKATNSVSEKIARQMACGVCVLFGSDLGIATTGYAEPNTQWKADPPFAYWAIAQRSGAAYEIVASGKVECPGLSRAEAQDRITETVLHAFESWLRGAC